MEGKLRYRPEIDGLRALAVVAVVLAHAGVPGVQGGFVGVDVFFVISGFLISGIIRSEVADGGFRFAGFYERRARRILPALIVVIAFCFPLAYFTMLPDPFENFGQSVVATLLFTNNVLLTLTSGYWDLAAEFKPLLHTWSLGVEEQFYILYPILAVAFLRLRRGYIAALVLGCLFSLSASVLLTPEQPRPAFYLIHTRAWELLLGALAFEAWRAIRPAPRVAQVASGLGLALVLAGITVIPSDAIYPGWLVVLPCLGAALFLAVASPATMAGRMMSLRMPVGIGLVSYSVYLWHQPLFAFARILSFEEPGPIQMAMLSLASLGAGYLSWRFVEQPFRVRTRVPTRAFLGLSGLAGLCLLVLGTSVHVGKGFPGRFSGLGLTGFSHGAYTDRAFALMTDDFPQGEGFRLLIVGDSTARDVVNIMGAQGAEAAFRIVYRSDLNPCDPPGGGSLRNLVRQADGVVVSGIERFDNCARVASSDPDLAGKPLIVLGPKHFGFNLNAYARIPEAERGDARAPVLVEVSRDNALARARAEGARFVDLLDEMEQRFGGVPVFGPDGRILSADRVHLTPAGASFFASFLFEHLAWQGFGLGG